MYHLIHFNIPRDWKGFQLKEGLTSSSPQHQAKRGGHVNSVKSEVRLFTSLGNRILNV